ncbi:MAG: hypothetical protein BWY59_00594 [Verrucomicrobia bacterium ADurb.Bin345]|nr:MAG: hypothetical protein BWY59_00594 [Verrucomicrobia bacterium ADurb.Bin345]
MPVVGAEAAMRRVLRRHQRQQRLEVPLRGSLADHHVHAHAELLARLLERRGLVIRPDARRDVRGQVAPRHARRMTVHRPRARDFEFPQNLGITGDHAGIVHHLRQPDDALVVEKQRDVRRGEPGPGGLHVGRRHAGRRHDEDAQREILARLEDVPDAVQPVHVGHLMRIGNHRGHAAREHGARELRHRNHAAFQVNMRIHEPRTQVPAVQVHGFARLVRAEAHDEAIVDGDIRFLDFTGKDVDHPPVLQEEVHRRFPAGGGDDVRALFVDIHCLTTRFAGGHRDHGESSFPITPTPHHPIPPAPRARIARHTFSGVKGPLYIRTPAAL